MGRPEDEFCPVCGYYCAGNGGVGCIDKPTMVNNMDNQHRKIKGYRELSQDEINLMNKIKETAAEVGELVSELEVAAFARQSDEVPDPRWTDIGKTDLQKGFMALTRSIAKPDFF